jgi:hypothetical protein
VPNSSSCENRLLASLPPAVFDRLRSQLVPVQLASGDVLFRAHDAIDVVYFPETAVVCSYRDSSPVRRWASVLLDVMASPAPQSFLE